MEVITHMELMWEKKIPSHAFEDGCLVLDKTTFREPHLFDCLAKASKALIPEPFLRLSKQCFWNTEHLMLCSCC